MDAPRYRIGNDLSVFWAIHNRDNSPFDMEGMDVRLFVTNERGRKEVDVVLATLPDGTINNVIRWDFKGEDQRVLGLHTLTVEILESATHREIIRDYCQAFEMVGRSESETEEGDANISVGGDLILSSKLDIYRFEATNVDLSGIKESMHDISESIKDINEESVEIKVAINGIQTQVNDIGTELTTKASVETVVEIGEQITEVQTNVAEQTIRVNSLEAEIETKASAESVTNIADELKITNETLAQQVVKVTDLTAEVATKASSEMVTEIADDLEITSNTLAEQTLRVDALSAEVSTKASAESVADITEDLQLVEKSVAEQTLRVDAMSAEIATKASSERVLALEGDVAVVERAVAEQTVKVEGLEASIENKVSREEFNEKTGELDQSYTSLKQTADSLTLEVGEQGEALTKVEADVNGLSVRVDDIGDAQANYDETLSELTEILTPEQMSTQIGKGVVLSTVIATRDEDGDITAGMNASSVHSDPVHGRVVIAGGVKNKSDWTKATGILYEDGHMVVNSGEFGENVKIGNAMFRAVLEGDFDVFSYPENGALVPLFQVNKDSDGKIVSVSTPYDFIANKNLIVHGDTSSGGEGSGEVVIGTTSIVVDGVSYPSKDGVIDLSKAFEGLQVEIDLSDYATKNELLVVNNRLVSLESYFATSEDADTQINKWNEIVAFLNATEGTTLAGILATYYTKNEIDGKITTINNSITALDDKYAPVKTWYDALGSLIVNENGSVRIKANLIVDGDTASGGEGGSSSVGIQGIKLNGTTYRDENGDGIIDLGTIGGGTLTEITYEMIVEALGYTPVNSASLGSLAYANGVTWAQVSGLLAGGDEFNIVPSGHNGVFSFNHRAKDGGSATITEYRMRNGGGSYAPVRASSFIAHGGTSSQFLKADGSLDSTSYLSTSGGTLISVNTNVLTLNSTINGGLLITGTYLNLQYQGEKTAEFGHGWGLGTYMWANGHTLRITNDGIAYVDSNTLYHSGNFNPADYLPLSGGTLTGKSNTVLTVNTSATNEVGIGLRMSNVAKGWIGYNPSWGTHLYTYSGSHRLGVKDDGTGYLDSNILLHSGNVGEYALKIDGSNAMTGALQLYSRTSGTVNVEKNDGLFLYRGPSTGGVDTGLPGNYYNLLNIGASGMNSNLQLSWIRTPNSSIFARVQENNEYGSWREFAFTDSNVASATYASNARILVDAQGGKSVAYISGNIFYIGDSIYPTTSTHILGNDVRLRYGANASTGLILNSAGNVTIGDSDLASTNYRLYVSGSVIGSSFKTLGRYALGDYFRIEFYNTAMPMIQTYDANLLLNPLGGNVLIGTTTDAGYKLYVEGTTYHSTELYLANWAYLASYKTDGSRVLMVGLNNNNLLTINQSGSGVNTAILGSNVGIGTTDPKHKLDVNGDISIPNNHYIAMSNTAGSALYQLWMTANDVFFVGRGSVENGHDSVYCGKTIRFSAGNSAWNNSGTFDEYGNFHLTGAVTMASTLNVGSYMTFNNGDIMYARDEGGTLRYIMGLTSVLSLGYESAYAGIDTHIYGNSIHLHHGTSRGTGLSLYSDGSSQLHGNTTINGNLVVTGDISA